MSTLRQEIKGYIDNIPERKLEALKPLLSVLADDSAILETDLTAGEREIIADGRKAYAQGGFVPLENIF